MLKTTLMHPAAVVAVFPAGEEGGGVALMSFFDLLVDFFFPPPSQDQSLPIVSGLRGFG